MAGTLYLCATPIGNLEDMTFRAVRVLGEVDLIAAEDTRNSIKLLNHFEIHTPMTSYHEYNRIEKGYHLVSLLLEGKNIALIFEKTSTRTRCSFEVAAHDLGMGTTYLDPAGSQIGKKGFWAGCLTASNTVDTARRLWRNWQNTPEFPCGTG